MSAGTYLDRIQLCSGARFSACADCSIYAAVMNRPLDEEAVIRVGGWDGRYAVVRAVHTLGDRAAAVIDSNGDGVDINLEHFAWSEGDWQLRSSSGGAGDWGRGWHDGMWAEHNREGDVWWLTLEPGAID